MLPKQHIKEQVGEFLGANIRKTLQTEKQIAYIIMIF